MYSHLYSPFILFYDRVYVLELASNSLRKLRTKLLILLSTPLKGWGSECVSTCLGVVLEIEPQAPNILDRLHQLSHIPSPRLF